MCANELVPVIWVDLEPELKS